MNQSFDIYLPVCVTFENGAPVRFQVDFEGPPWAYSGTTAGTKYAPDENENDGWCDPSDDEVDAAQQLVEGGTP